MNEIRRMWLSVSRIPAGVVALLLLVGFALAVVIGLSLLVNPPYPDYTGVVIDESDFMKSGYQYVCFRINRQLAELQDYRSTYPFIHKGSHVRIAHGAIEQN